MFAEGSIAVRPDADLVRLFLSGQAESAEAAFETLIARHGAMVLGICRRILRDEHQAEDAFQAVFLILARKARTVRVEDSLGRWLHGVSRRVALRARGLATRKVPAMPAPGITALDPALAADRAEVRELIGREVARLPRKYGEPLALCHLDGLSHDQAAEALGVPVGTVRSRLSRARVLLRTRLACRGLAPAAAAAWISSRHARASVPNPFLEMTLKNSAGSVTAAAAIPSSVLLLARLAMRNVSMAKATGAFALTAAIGMATATMVVVAGRNNPSNAPPPADGSKPRRDLDGPVSLDDQFRKIVREYDDAKDKAEAILATAKNGFERSQMYGRVTPDLASYARRVVDLAAAHPKEAATRDALIWVMNKPSLSDEGPYGDEFSRAVNLLVHYHGDDPEVARVGLSLNNLLSRRRDAFLEGIFACAQGREARGLARIALAQYLEKKAEFVAAARKYPGRSRVKFETYDEQGKLVTKTTTLSNEEEGYRVHERMLDPDFIRRESERLYEEVVVNYADVPYITTHRRELEQLVRETPPSTVTDLKKKQELVEIERYLAEERPSTLGEVAAGHLDEIRNLAIGKLAPDFEGVGADGKLIKLSNHRGKVVALAYWFSACGPCLREIPHQRALAAKMKGRPFTLLGIVSDGRNQDARRIIETEGISWPNLVSGGDKVAAQYHVASNPAYFVLDAAGVIRAKGRLDADSLGTLVERLVSETEAIEKAKSAPGK
jgi:RNA polymerase sigma factor (sigma-70 family)